MKKILLFILTILMFGGASVSSASASTVDEQNVTWYTVAELLEYKNQMDLEFSEKCGSDLNCVKALHSEKLLNDSKYTAMFVLEARTFSVTSINHHEKNFKILFFDERISIKKNLGKPSPKLVLKDAYLGWFDNVISEREFSGGFSRQPDTYYDNQVEGAHLMLGKRMAIDGNDWLSAYNVEVEYSMVDDETPTTNFGTMKFDLTAVTGYASAGTISYSNCLNSESYSEEGGCKLMVSAEKGIEYFPVERNGNNDDQLDGPTDEPTNEPIDNPTDDPIINTPNEFENSLEDNSKKEQSSNIVTATLKLNPPKAPNTGSQLNPCTQRTIEFPWWLMFLIALGDAVVFWLFWPKKSKKPIDKKQKVR